MKWFSHTCSLLMLVLGSWRHDLLGVLIAVYFILSALFWQFEDRRK